LTALEKVLAFGSTAGATASFTEPVSRFSKLEFHKTTMPEDYQDRALPAPVEMSAPPLPLTHYLWILKRHRWKIARSSRQRSGDPDCLGAAAAGLRSPHHTDIDRQTPIGDRQDRRAPPTMTRSSSWPRRSA